MANSNLNPTSKTAGATMLKENLSVGPSQEFRADAASMESHTFGKWDYAVFGVMVAASVSIGIYHAIVGRHGKLDEYLLAGRSMTFFPVAMSLIATFTSTITMLGASAESYNNGIMWILNDIALCVGKLLEMYLLLDLLKRLNISSPFQYIEGRFKSRVLSLIMTGASCFENVFYMSIILFGHAIALQAVTGFSTLGSILATAVAVVLYTAIGGLKAVIWTDVLQYIIMFAGILAVMIKGTLRCDPDPTIRHTVWNVGVARVFTGLGAMLFGLICGPMFGALCIISGLVAYGYYDYKRCDPIASNQIDNVNQILPFLTLDIFRNLPGMAGLFLAALYSASLSSLSSGLSALANITWEEFVRPRFPEMLESKQIAVAKLSGVDASGGNKDGVNPIYVRKFYRRRQQEEEHVMTEESLPTHQIS
ncbi:sodium-coupled monocarboxylate transporter 1-like [Haliotis rubra]|uniref:sodium-coupled monocarboxylate transporter 1-like n=1 Tax=Haliotis rubra TaxID=36100 RepID=UPI001EE57D4A|nr:sodium-coupled monocarboxylate transporter 1-like [Haliotis rubra]